MPYWSYYIHSEYTYNGNAVRFVSKRLNIRDVNEAREE